MTVEIHDGNRWQPVCTLDDLQPGRGVAVLLAAADDGNDAQVALFLDRAGALHAVDNRDPFSGAYVLSRGLLGSRGDRPTLASPMYKQVFDLTDGRCLDEDTAPDGSPAVLRRWPVRTTAEHTAPHTAPRPARGTDSQTDSQTDSPTVPQTAPSTAPIIREDQA
ncbi:nitrite reductase (NAD(P)H) small subunit [Kitasatospora sp. NPDC058406]|uniref:nitrite reductase (NAD(P)H) small subunit n=1 Tax=Kitasatospora sp. NPDC058406 TaxID=3346483 RepID=UPI003654D604